MLLPNCPMANIYDVARTARVSVATVSAAVNGTAFVSPALKSRVQRAVKQLGYQPNLLARSLATQQSRTIGMIVPDIANPFFPEVVRGAEDAAYAAGYMLLIASSDNDLSKEEVYLRLFVAKRVDGVIFTKAPGAMPKTLQTALGTRGRAPRPARADGSRTSGRYRRNGRQARRPRRRHASVASRLSPHRIHYWPRRCDDEPPAARRLPRGPAGLAAAGRSRPDRRRRLPRRIGLPGRPRAPEEPARRSVHLELPDERGLHGSVAAIPAALSGGC